MMLIVIAATANGCRRLRLLLFDAKVRFVSMQAFHA